MIIYQPKKLKPKLAKGVTCQTSLFALDGTKFSFVNNFKPSAIGCKIPQKPTTAGPIRL